MLRLTLLALTIGALPSLVSAQYGGGGGGSSSTSSAAPLKSTTATSAAAQSSSTGTVHDIDVGDDGFVFTPNTLTAAKGDIVNFHFYPGDHSVAQSTFDAPCVPAPGNPIYSGFINPTGTGEASMMFSLTVNDTNPIWLYCSQVTHCQTGMGMVINAPSGSTIAEYIAAAKKTTTSTSPATVEGGSLIANKDTDSDSSSASGSASATSSASGSASAASSAPAATTTAAASGAELGKAMSGVAAIVAMAMGVAAWGMM